RIKVHGIPPPHADSAPPLGRPCFFAPQEGRAMDGPGGQRDAGGQAGLQHIATAQTWGRSSGCRRCVHGFPSLWLLHASSHTRVTYSQLCNLIWPGINNDFPTFDPVPTRECVAPRLTARPYSASHGPRFSRIVRTCAP